MNGLGMDWGGTATRWAVADEGGAILAEGALSMAMEGHISHPANQAALSRHLQALAAAVAPTGPISAVLAGVTGLEGAAQVQAFIQESLGQALAVAPTQVCLGNDLLISFLDAMAPGEGYLVYAGTGSIAAHVDAQHGFHRAGGRGHLLDDAGGGYWIAKEAFRRVWREEDERPGGWERSPMAVRLFNAIGGSAWEDTVQFFYQRGRGDIGKVAVEVARSVDDDPRATLILQKAGDELARLADTMVARLGARPVVVAGGAAHLHPLVFEAMCATLRSNVPCTLRRLQPQRRAAVLAAQAGFPHNTPFAKKEVHAPT